MSPAQFSELITTLNFSSGTPCTVEIVAGQEIPQVNPKEVENRKSFVNRKIKERLKDFASRLIDTQNRAKELVKKKTLSKNDQHNLLAAIEFMTTEITSNIPFFAKCFQENMDDVILDAKVEIDSTIQHMITKSGIKALSNYQKPIIREIEQ